MDSTNIILDTLQNYSYLYNEMSGAVVVLSNLGEIFNEALSAAYEWGNNVLTYDAKEIDKSHSGVNQNTYDNDSTWFQNFQSQINTVVQAESNTISTMENAMQDVTKMMSTLNDFASYESNLLSSSLV